MHVVLVLVLALYSTDALCVGRDARDTLLSIADTTDATIVSTDIPPATNHHSLTHVCSFAAC